MIVIKGNYNILSGFNYMNIYYYDKYNYTEPQLLVKSVV